MKRLTTLLMASLLVVSLAACGDAKDTGSTNSGANISQSSTTSSVSSSQVDSKDNAVEPVQSESDNQTSDTNGSAAEIEFEEIVVVDNDECSIKITGVELDDEWGHTIKVQLENRSADTNYTYSIDSAAINGVMCKATIWVDVPAGKKATDEIHSLAEDLIDGHIDIGDCTDIELTFTVFDSDDLIPDDMIKETVHIYPYGEDKATKFAREAQETDNTLIDNEYVTVIATGTEEDSDWSYNVNLFLINKTDKAVMIDFDDVSVNDYMIDPYCCEQLEPGKCMFSAMQLLNDDLADNNITTIDKIEFEISAYYVDDWDSDGLFSGKFTLQP